MAQQTIYCGRFIDTPSADELRIRLGALLVGSKDGRGMIEKADWTVNGPNDAASKLGVEAPVVTAKDDGFFFPGFIGLVYRLSETVSKAKAWQTRISTLRSTLIAASSANPPSSTGSRPTPFL